MRRQRRTFWFPICLAFLAGFAVWVVLAWFLQPQPARTIMKDFFPDEAFLQSHGTHLRKIDSTGRWIASCYGESQSDGKMKWVVRDLHTAAVRELAWHDVIGKPSVPIPGGLRHARQNESGNWEIVDTSFQDGTSLIRLALPLNTRLADYMLFNQDGTQAMTLHPFPCSLLRLLGNFQGPAWDALAVEHLAVEAKKRFYQVQIDPLLARLWSVETGKPEHALLLPAFTNLNGLQWSPNGRWLLRPETGLQPNCWLPPAPNPATPLNLPSSASPSPIPLQAALPRGILAYDTSSGKVLSIPVSFEDPKEGAYFIFGSNAGLSYCPLMMYPQTDSGIPVLCPSPRLTSGVVVDGVIPFHRLPDGHQLPWMNVFGSRSTSDIPPVQTVDGALVAVVQTQDSDAVASVTFSEQAIQIQSAPVELGAEDTIHLEPTRQPGIVLATWESKNWPYRALKWAAWVGVDLDKRFPRDPAVCCALVDVHHGKILLQRRASYQPNAEPPKYELTADGAALLLMQRNGRDLCVLRWELPWEGGWSWWITAISVGVAGVFFILLRKWLSRQAITL
jgi:hypothetical protein